MYKTPNLKIAPFLSALAGAVLGVGVAYILFVIKCGEIAPSFGQYVLYAVCGDVLDDAAYIWTAVGTVIGGLVGYIFQQTCSRASE